MYSQNCVACKNNEKRDTVKEATKDETVSKVKNITSYHCPWNYIASSKGMEGSGAIALIMEILQWWWVCSRPIYQWQLDNLGKCAPLVQRIYDSKRNYKKSQCLAKNIGGNCVANQGKLPLCIRPINKFLADPSHRDKNFGCALYKLEGKWGKKLTFTSTNCECLKQNYSFWHRQNQDNTYITHSEIPCSHWSLLCWSYILSSKEEGDGIVRTKAIKN